MGSHVVGAELALNLASSLNQDGENGNLIDPARGSQTRCVSGEMICRRFSNIHAPYEYHKRQKLSVGAALRDCNGSPGRFGSTPGSRLKRLTEDFGGMSQVVDMRWQVSGCFGLPKPS
jgi:hypothetical protein